MLPARPHTALLPALLLLLAGSPALGNSDNDNGQGKRPNFIVIQPDDFLFFREWNPPARFYPYEDYDDDVYGDDDASGDDENTKQRAFESLVPSINRLRDHGLELTNAYAASTMCGTSRYSTLTGRYPSRSAYGRETDAGEWVYGAGSGAGSDLLLRKVVIPRTKLEDVDGWGRDCTEDNLAAVLQRHGYATGVVGKWHLTDTESGSYDSYEETKDRVKRCGFGVAEAIYKENTGGPFLDRTNADGGEVTHNMEHLTSEAIRFMEDHLGGGTEEEQQQQQQPFFLYFNPTVPHYLQDVTDALRYADCRDTVAGRLEEEPLVPYGKTAAYKNCKQYRKSVVERAEEALSSGSYDLGEVRGSPAAHDEDQSLEDRLLDKLAGAAWVDDAVGSLLDFLEDRGALNHTLVLFQLDHGMEAKGTLFEGGSRIPQFVHYPDGFGTGGTTLSAPASTIDVAPTLLELAGVVVPGENQGAGETYAMDGRSWAGEAASHKGGESSTGGAEAEAQALSSSRCLFVEMSYDRSVRCGCYKYVYVSTPYGGTAWAAETQGTVLSTHNFFDLCDETTGEYVTSPNASPELVPSSKIDQKIRDGLMAKMECLLRQTEPSDKDLDFEDDCWLPLFYVPPNQTTTDAGADGEGGEGAPPRSDAAGNHANETGAVHDESQWSESEPSVAEGLPGGDPGAGDSPAPVPDANVSSTEPPRKPTIADVSANEAKASDAAVASAQSRDNNKSILVVASFLLALAPVFFWWFYKEFCRRTKEQTATATVLYLPKGNQNDDCNVEVKIHGDSEVDGMALTHRTNSSKDSDDTSVSGNYLDGDIEARGRSITIHCKSSEPTKAIGGSDLLSEPVPLTERVDSSSSAASSVSIWDTLAEENTRRSMLREKFNILSEDDAAPDAGSEQEEAPSENDYGSDSNPGEAAGSTGVVPPSESEAPSAEGDEEEPTKDQREQEENKDEPKESTDATPDATPESSSSSTASECAPPTEEDATVPSCDAEPTKEETSVPTQEESTDETLDVASGSVTAAADENAESDKENTTPSEDSDSDTVSYAEV